MLPAPLHPSVARECVAAGRHLVTASYVSEEMRSMAAEAEERGVLLLNECGLDRGGRSSPNHIFTRVGCRVYQPRHGSLSLV